MRLISPDSFSRWGNYLEDYPFACSACFICRPRDCAGEIEKPTHNIDSGFESIFLSKEAVFPY